MAIIINLKVREKLLYKIPPTRPYEIEECFRNRTTRILIENRGKHRTNPPSQWFIAETIAGKRLKVVFILNKNGDQVIKTAYVPDLAEERIYEEKPEDATNYQADEDWEIKKYRASAKYAELGPIENDIALDESLGLAPISIRLQKELVAKLKVMAKDEGLAYQSYIRQILTRHAKGTPSAKEKRRASK